MIIISLFFCYFSSSRHSNENIIFKFTNSFNNDSIIQKWKFLRYNKKNRYENGRIILKRVISKIKDVLIKIETDDYKDLKRLILSTQIQSFNDVSFFYFETFVAIRSIQRILKINKNNPTVESWHTKEQMVEFYKNIINLSDDKLRYPTHRKPEYFYEKVILFEYACIYNDILQIMKIISKKCFNWDILNTVIGSEYHYSNFLIFKLLSAENTKFFIEYAINTIDKILMLDIKQPICILTSPNGITHSLKFFKENMKNYIPNEYTIIDTDKKNQQMDNRDTKRDSSKHFDIDFILDKTLVYDRSSMELFLILIHYHSVMNNFEYMYEFIFVETNLYKVKCFKYDLKTLIKSYYLKKEISDDGNIKTIHKFALILDYDNEYTTIKPNDSKIEPIKTRVIKLSCGHLLGLELIDEWFSMLPNLKCHLCMIDVTILGSFDTDVYKC